MSQMSFAEDPEYIPLAKIVGQSSPLEQIDVQAPDSSGPIGVAPKSNDARSFLERFISAFFQESNIKWMLMIGAAIVTVCSLKLVAQQWEDWTVTLKFMSILVYIAAVYGFAEGAERLLNLRSTSTVLRCLTLVLFPISFYSLGWLSNQAGQSVLTWIPLLALGGTLCWFVSDRIFTQLLRGRQPTFQISYLLLSLSCALPQFENQSLFVAIGVWLVGTIGIVKVNRHLFWLNEEHRKPLVMGFLPILLVGAQMLLLFATKMEWSNQLEWLGFGLVLCAVPIGLTARTVAKVYRSRTGGLITTLPAAIVIPIFVALAFTAAGVVLSFHGFQFSPNSTLAAVPTTAVAACLAILAARDTKHSGFTWLALVLMTASYQCTPTLAAGFAKAVVSSAAHSLSEERLPFAFYGMTYLPLLLSWLAASTWLNARFGASVRYLTQPMKLFATFLALATLSLSVTHLKAAFLIPTLHVLLFSLFAYSWQDRRYAAVALLSLCVSVGLWVPFANQTLVTHFEYGLIPLSLACLACGLLCPAVDRWINRLPMPAGETVVPMATTTGAFLAIGVSAIWCLLQSIAFLAQFSLDVVRFGTVSTTVLGSTAVACTMANLIFTARTRHYLAGLPNAAIAVVLILNVLPRLPLGVESILDIATYTVVTIAILAYGLVTLSQRRTGFDWHQLRSQLGLDLNRIEISGIAPGRCGSLLAAVMLPIADIATIACTFCLSIHASSLLLSNLIFNHEFLHISMAAIVLWLICAIRLTHSRIAATVSVALSPLMVSSLLQSQAYLPSNHSVSAFIWATTLFGFVAIPYRIYLELRGKSSNSDLKPDNNAASISVLRSNYVPVVASGWFMALSAVSILMNALPLQLAGLISLAGLWLIHRPAIARPSFAFGCMLGNFLLLLLSQQWMPIFDIDQHKLFGPGAVERPELPLYIVILAANIAAVRYLSSSLNKQWHSVWLTALQLMAAGVFCLCFITPIHSPLAVALIVIATFLIAAQELYMAIRENSEFRVWKFLGQIGLCLALLMSHKVLVASGAVIPIAFASAGFAMQQMSLRCKSGRTSIIARPFAWTGDVLNWLVTLIGLGSIVQPTTQFAMQTLTISIFLVSFATLHRAWSSNNRNQALFAILTLNIGVALITRSMGWTDLQLYLVPIGLSVIGLVQLLQKQLPRDLHKPLRMVGSLIILVSPIFQILHGSWWHILSLMVLAVCVVLIAIGLRIRSLMYTGVAFLFADLLAMLVRSAIDNPDFLWISGLGIGIGVIGIAALCEIYREKLLSRVRYLSSELATWN